MNRPDKKITDMHSGHINISRKPGADKQLIWNIPKERLCLRCKVTFHSDWSGERICSRCKSSGVWKSGSQF
ncbi:hypothetical protein [Kordiimonas pumila]|uniref:Transcriptional regulator n=1 Tax=Kordiimonas pumila TaxID=2161677 RepID=A0ABV7D0X4_9PROT|nr:hypothetical protein [Kordiimonas pumila]